MLETVFLGKQDVEKYQMLTIIKSLPKAEINLSSIGNGLGFTYQKTYNIFQALLDDIFDLDPGADQKSSKIESINFDRISIDNYRLFLFKNSIVFQAFNYGFTNANPTFENFSNSHFTSKSTLNRRMTNFRKLLKNFGLKISNATLELKGDEKNIRCLAYFVYWYTYHGLEWPFKLIQQDTIQKIVERDDNPVYNPAAKYQLEILLGISRIRLIKHYYLNNMDGYDEVFQGKILGKELITREDYSLIPMDKLDNENKFINTFKDFFFIPTEFIEPDAPNLSNLVDPEFNELTDKFLKFMKRKYKDNFHIDLNSPEADILRSDVVSDICFYYIMGHEAHIKLGSYTRDPSEYETVSSVFDSIYEFFSNVDEEKFGPIRNSTESIAHDLYKGMINQISGVRDEDILHVKLLTDAGNPVKGYLLHTLESMEYIKVMPSSAYKNVDILMTTLDVFPDYEGRDKYPDDLIVIPWNLNSLRTDYIYLLLRLYNIYAAKLKHNKEKDQDRHLEI
ncbi:helix-turn-helix domain-containing protein [Companilactobacillus sp.]|uniref:helix-turn-helix domain-containing protein n=1 Tax=Companilactobacillus sp. TaxID=2767905 RepID=UPI0034522E87